MTFRKFFWGEKGSFALQYKIAENILH